MHWNQLLSNGWDVRCQSTAIDQFGHIAHATWDRFRHIIGKSFMYHHLYWRKSTFVFRRIPLDDVNSFRLVIIAGIMVHLCLLTLHCIDSMRSLTFSILISHGPADLIRDVCRCRVYSDAKSVTDFIWLFYFYTQCLSHELSKSLSNSKFYLLLYTQISCFATHIVWSTFLSKLRSWFSCLLVKTHVSLPYSRTGRIKVL
jgi:hypothetical protein